MRTIRELMTPTVITVGATEQLGPVKARMLEDHVHCVPVLGQGGDLLGIVTATDVMELWDPAQSVATVMTSPVITVEPTITTVHAARLMLDNHVHHLIVVDDDVVTGVVSSFDLLRDIAGELEAVATSTPGYGKPGAEVGDVIVIRGHRLGRPPRRGVVAEVLGDDGGPPYVVHWLDDSHEPPHDVLFFPGPDADIEHG
jgi:predicted transcriptional regulator